MTGVLAPGWIVLPMAALLMFAVAGHTIAISHSRQPASRKRIRQANGGLILVTIPLLATGLSLLDPARHAREWALVWMASVALLGFVIILALLDVANTVRLARRAARKLSRSWLSDHAPSDARRPAPPEQHHAG